jgi:prepilin-type N-terminal cleavage/methylation domain-containing protein
MMNDELKSDHHSVHRSAFIVNRCRCGFTLVEVLIVVAVLGLLMAILFPVFGRVRESGRRSVCISNLRQIGLACQMYELDFNRRLPPRLSAIHPQYLGDARLFLCPDDARKGQFPGNTRMEANLFLPTGVSYEYIPNWTKAQELGWYRAAPRYGSGKWDDLTPLAGCLWHWAKYFDPDASSNATGARGWQLYLTRGGSVRKVRIEEPVENFTPAKYN